MTQNTFEVVIETKDVQAELDRISERLSQTSLVGWLEETMVPWLDARAEDRFVAEGDETVGGWAPLSAATQNIRASGTQRGLWAVGPDHPINVRTHELENYIVHGVGDTAPMSTGAALVFPGKKGLTPSVKDKLKTAQKGYRSAPPRPVLGLGERDLQFAMSRLVEHIMETP